MKKLTLIILLFLSVILFSCNKTYNQQEKITKKYNDSIVNAELINFNKRIDDINTRYNLSDYYINKSNYCTKKEVDYNSYNNYKMSEIYSDSANYYNNKKLKK